MDSDGKKELIFYSKPCYKRVCHYKTEKEKEGDQKMGHQNLMALLVQGWNRGLQLQESPIGVVDNNPWKLQYLQWKGDSHDKTKATIADEIDA
eukprot:scaffold50556_cov72-Attheya_sp.AAC.1